MKVVIPAMTSVFTSVLLSFSLNSLCSISNLLHETHKTRERINSMGHI